jgi:hypothetical protein
MATLSVWMRLIDVPENEAKNWSENSQLLHPIIKKFILDLQSVS